MSRVIPAIVCAAILSALSVTVSAQRPAPGATFAIDNVTTIDVTTGARSANQTVVVRGSRIVAVGPSATVRPPAGAQVVDGRGRFLIPGMWDMHAHPGHNIPEKTLPLFVARGITGVRDMGSGIENTHRMTGLVDGGLIAPRLKVSGALLDGTPQDPQRFGDAGVTLTTPDQAREMVNRHVAQRVDLLKIHNGLQREVFLAIADEAKKYKLPFGGHLPLGMTAVEASDAGQGSIEHAALNALCVRDPNDLRPPAAGAPAPPTPLAVDEAKCEQALRRLRQNGTYFSPTILAPGSGNARTRALSLAVIRLANKVGVRLLTGTDGPGGGYWRGDYGSIDRWPQDDMAGMVEAGLTPLEALRAGTLNPALLFGMENQLGRISAGSLADLVLLDADPLVDITNTKRINAVVANGRLVDAALRQRLIDEELTSRKPAPAPTR